LSAPAPLLERIARATGEALLPPTRLTVSEWADRNRILTRETSAEFGQWRTSRVPYAREIMDSLSALDPCEYVCWMKAAQIAATEVGLNWIGYTIEHDPGPMLLVVPTDGFARRYSKRRIAPMIAACPALSSRVSAARSRDSGNTMLQKDFPGGVLAMSSAQSASALSSDPIRRVFADEIDRFPHDVDDEGTPLALAETRTTNFPNRKIYAASTPGKKENSFIEPAFLSGDMRRYFVPCPHCSHVDFITWRGQDPFKRDELEHFKIVWDEDKPDTATMLCPKCGVFIEERYKTWMLERGAWRATASGDGHMRSYHLPGMYSPLGWLSWARMAREFLKATKAAKRGDDTLLQDFVNLRLGETWEERGIKIESNTLLARAIEYPAPVPAGVGVLVASVDVQGDRLEAQVTGYGAGEQSWVIDWRQFHGDPESEALWFELDAYLKRTWRHESGRMLPIECTTIDSGGHHSEQVYAFCKARIERRVFAVKGGVDMAKPLVEKPTRNNKYRTPLFVLCVDTGKDRVYSRMMLNSPGPGYMNFPKCHWFDEEYVAQLTAEKKIGKWLKGRGSVPFWKKLRDRNEALDLTVYALAALYILGRDFIDGLEEEAERWAKPLADGEVTSQARPEAPEAQQVAPPAEFPAMLRDGGWMNGWRR
jgi:phage terminase large subunit GpA-like protein